jgi:hypothetical protein
VIGSGTARLIEKGESAVMSGVIDVIKPGL